MKEAHSRSRSDRVFPAVNTLLMLLMSVSILYPVWYIFVNSLNDGQDMMNGAIYWIPRMFSLENYHEIFRNSAILKAFGITSSYTALTTTLHVFITSMVAWAVSKRHILFRRFYLAFGTVTMFMSGGLIPYFLLIKGLGMVDSYLVYVIPGLFSFYNLIIFMSFFRQLPSSLEESAKIDGASDFFIFVRIIIPLSLPVLAAIALFVGVANWNDYFTGVIFINNQNLQPIQTFLYKVIAQNESHQLLAASPVGMAVRRTTSQSLKLATMVVTTLPIIFIYPFLQRYFIKGILIGSIKG